MMKIPVLKTIFGKMIFIFVLILLLSFSITGGMLYYFLNNLVAGEKEKQLEQTADWVKEAFGSYVQNSGRAAAGDYDKLWAKGIFEQSLESYSKYTNSFIWIVEESGHIVFSSPPLPVSLTESLEDSTGYVKLADERQYKRIMEKQDSTYKEIGNFYGFFGETSVFRDYGNSWLTISKSFKVQNKNSASEVIAAVYLHTPMPQIQKARWSVFKLFVFSVLVSVFIGIILIYIFSLRISRPLKQIRNAAKVIAGGEFQKRLSINTRDEIGELASSFNQMALELQTLEEMRRGFIANVSHELRTPMTSIRGFIEGILDGTIPTEKQNNYLTIVRDETNRLNRLVNNLLDLARMESGEITLKYKAFNINELIRRCIIKLESLIVEKDISIEADFEEEDMFVYADIDAVERVIINLVHNAIKFTAQNGKINVATIYQKGKVFVSVKDTGEGIGQEEIAKIWDRFYKSDKSRGRDKTGTGLGLAIVKNIINDHNQEIWVESELEQGTQFTFTFERAYGEDS